MLPFIRSDLAQFTAYKPHPGSDTAEAAQASVQLDRLDTNESPYDLPPQLKEKVNWTYAQLIETNRYPDGGHGELKSAIAQYVNESANLPSSPFTTDNISIGNGSDELIRSILIATCIGGEGSILVAHPTFSMYAILAKTLGIGVVSINRNPDTFEMDLQAAQMALQQPQTPVRVVFVVHPNSPTANPLTSAELAWLVNLPPEILVVIDEAYFEFSQNTLASQLLQHPNWIIMRTFSKAFRLAAHRVGYAVAHPELIATLEKIRLPYNLPSVSIAAALIALQHRQLLLASISETLNERAKLITALSSYPALHISDSSTNFLYVRLDTNHCQESLTSLTAKLKAAGTLVRCLSDGLRITVGSPAENLRTIDRLLAVLN